jgi:hypothetical protein
MGRVRRGRRARRSSVHCRSLTISNRSNKICVAGTSELTSAVAAAVSTPTHLVQLSDELECGDDDYPRAD